MDSLIQAHFDHFVTRALGPVHQSDYARMLGQTMEEVFALTGDRRTTKAIRESLATAAQQLEGWYQSGLEYELTGGGGLPSFVVSHRAGCVWAVLLRKQHAELPIAEEACAE